MGEQQPPVTGGAASFAADPSSVREARRFLRRWISANPLPEAVHAAAELALSELATNAVLHAHTEFEVRVLRIGVDGMRVEVTDRWPGLPLLKSHGNQAATGRGLELVVSLADEIGVELHGDEGKTIWFTVRRSDASDAAAEAPGQAAAGADSMADVDIEELMAAWGDDLTVGRAATDGHTSILLRGLPLGLWLLARAHHDSILRDLTLHAAAHPEDAPDQEQLTRADHARSWVSNRVAAAAERLTGHAPASPERAQGLFADLEVDVGDDALGAFRALDSVLDHCERLAAAGALLSEAGAEDVVALRRWACAEAESQLRGGRALPWADRTASAD